MKKFKFILLVSIPMLSLAALAQVPSPTPYPFGTEDTGGAAQWLIDLLLKYPKFTALLVVVGALRLILKPTFAFLHTIFQSVGLVAWDQKETAIEQSKPMKVLYFLIDYLGSIKVPVKQDDPTQPPPKV